MSEPKFPAELPHVGQKIVVSVGSREKECQVTDRSQDRKEETFYISVDEKQAPSLIFKNQQWFLIQEIPCEVEIVTELHHQPPIKKSA